MSKMIATYDDLHLDLNGRTATVTFRRTPHHAWTLGSLAALMRVIDDLDAHREVHCLVVTGEGGEFFSAGFDPEHFGNGDKDAARELAIQVDAAFERLAAFRGVSIAAINGVAMGPGLACALACDVRIADEHAVMALPEVGNGVIPIGGVTQLLPGIVGQGWARRMILCGERIDAATALRIGLVEEVTPRGTAVTRAAEIAARAEKQNPNGIAICKALMREQAIFSHEREPFVRMFDSNDPREGAQSKSWRKR
jgi:enoyl-CoA hydratase/carnithine racemase